MLVAGSTLAGAVTGDAAFYLILAASFALLLLCQFIIPIKLRYRGANYLPTLIDILSLFFLSVFSGGLESPLRSAYFLFIVVDTIGLRIRSTLAIAVAYCISYGLLDFVEPQGFGISDFQTTTVALHVLFLLWTGLIVALLAGILRVATQRAHAAALENAILFERAVRSGDALRSVLNSTENGIFMVGTDLRIRFVSRQMGDLIGTDISDVVGKEMPSIIRERLKHKFNAPDEFERRLLELYSDMEREAVDELIVFGSQPRELNRYSGPVRDAHGKLLGRIEVYSDVTEERAAIRLKDEFLSLVAHELKTPITSLKAYSQLLRRRPFREMPESLIQNALGTIDRQASQLALLVNDLLDVSRVETGQLQLHMSDFDLCGLIRDVIAQLAPMDTDHEFTISCPEQIGIHADPSRIEQVVVNLLTNAQKYSPDGGAIIVDVHLEGSEVITRVSDEGIGIPGDRLSLIFDRFYQAHGTPYYGYGGMGIGLYISKQIIERHGGRIWVESEERQGSRFYFSLPIGTVENA